MALLRPVRAEPGAGRGDPDEIEEGRVGARFVEGCYLVVVVVVVLIAGASPSWTIMEPVSR